MEKENEKKATRINLLDAVDLDSETLRILKDQLSKATNYLSAKFVIKWEAELDAILRFGIWRLSVCRHHATFGQQLLQVKYGNDFSKRKGQLLILLTVLCPYLKQKINQLTPRTDAQSNQLNLHHVKKMLSLAETVILMASVLNLLIFVKKGEYPTLIDRLLRLKPVSVSSPGTSRIVGYEYMTRELLWHGFIELITFMLPLINFQSLRRKISNYFQKDVPNFKETIKKIAVTTDMKCVVCNDVPILPHHVGCQHMFCYYCLESNKLADTNYECPLCGHPADRSISIISLNSLRLVML